MFFLFRCNFDSLEWQLGTYSFYVDLETSSKIKLICIPTQYKLSIPCSAVKSIFLSFSCVCQIYVAEVVIIHFFNHYHQKFLSPYDYQREVNFGGQFWIWIQLQIHVWVGLFDLNLGFSLVLAPALVPSKPHLTSLLGIKSGSRSCSRSIFGLYLHSGSDSCHLYVSPSIIMGGQLWIWITLQIHILVVLLYHNLGSTPAPVLGPPMSYLTSGGWTLDPDPAPDPYMGCTFRPEFRVHCGSGLIYVSPELIDRRDQLWIQIHLYIHLWVVFYIWIFTVFILCYFFSTVKICLITLFQGVRFKNSFTNRGHFFPDDHFEYQKLYVIFKIEHFIPYFSLSQYYLLYVYIRNIFKCNLDNLN